MAGHREQHAAVIPVPAEAGRREETLIVDVDGFEGPLDLLLALARTQKVDLARISLLALAEQYLAFVEEARRLRLEIAADYLVMAAWLAYLKSRLLLPEPETGEADPSGEELAAGLARRLARLEAIRRAGARIWDREQLHRDVFPRGMPEGIRVIRHPRFEASLNELIAAYARQRQAHASRRVVLHRRPVVSLKEARETLERIIGMAVDWLPLERILAPYVSAEATRATVLASSFAASLELAKDGRIELRQEGPFRPLYARLRPLDARLGSVSDMEARAE